MHYSWKGKTLGKCKLQKVIGDGASGVVYKAHHMTLGIDVAVKILPPHKQKENTITRFQQEARTAGRLEHQHVVRIFDVGYENEIHYIVMEYVDGKSVEYYLSRQGSLPFRKSVQIVQKIAQGLAAAHTMDILHRDIKPANILLGKNGEVKLADFGLARLSSYDIKLTETGAIIGTLAYIAPEQLRGESSHASDLYSLGVTLFEMLAGELPFNEKNAYGLINRHINSPVPSIRDLRAEIPQGIDFIIQKLMAKEPVERFPDANAVAEALAPFLNKKATARRTTALIQKEILLDATKGMETKVSQQPPQAETSPEDKLLPSVPMAPGPDLPVIDEKEEMVIRELSALDTFEVSITHTSTLSDMWIKIITIFLLFMASSTLTLAICIAMLKH